MIFSPYLTSKKEGTRLFHVILINYLVFFLLLVFFFSYRSSRGLVSTISFLCS
eukprot:c38712_g1_i1 orf=107-265(+)